MLALSTLTVAPSMPLQQEPASWTPCFICSALPRTEIFAEGSRVLCADPSRTVSFDENASWDTKTALPMTSPLRRYCYLAFRLQGSRPGTNAMNSPSSEMTKYMDEIQQGIACENPLDFWRSREAIYPRLAPVALDLVSAPASQAFMERIFSMCGLLSSGLRNRTTTSLKQRVFLKINEKLLS